MMKKSWLNKLIFSIFLIFGIVSHVFAISCNDKVIKDSNGNITTPSTCIIFMTKDKYNGGGLEGLDGANKKCQKQAQIYYPDLVASGISFKALLAWNSATVRGKNYYRPYDSYSKQQVYIGQASGPNLSRNLANSFLDQSGDLDDYRVWTGLGDGISMHDYDTTCYGWRSNSTNGGKNYHGSAGNASMSVGWDDSDKSPCDSKKRLLCAAQ